MNQTIYGLVLVGGKSRRMGSDKALLRYGDQGTQLERTAGLLNSVCEKVFISQRAEQRFECPEKATPIYDSVEDARGPLCGILSAMAAHPQAHWLVLACDLPFLKHATLEKLIREFQNTEPQLTAYRSTHDGLPEPLCAIYPSGSGEGLLALAKELDKSCPRKLLIVKQAHLVEQDDPSSLDNINTAEEYAQTTGESLPLDSESAQTVEG
ncbi:MAG: NTP transferase domain-containing protein [Opitutaceae bacterium]